MTRRVWIAGVVLLAVAVLAHAAWPRYEWHSVTSQPLVLVRVDRWTSRAQWGVMDRTTGTWEPLRPVITDADVDKVLSDIDRALGPRK